MWEVLTWLPPYVLLTQDDVKLLNVNDKKTELEKELASSPDNNVTRFEIQQTRHARLFTREK